MSTRRTLLRGASALALALTIVGSSAIAPSAFAATNDDPGYAEASKTTAGQPQGVSPKNVPGLEGLGVGDLPIGDLGIGDLGSGGIESVPIIGDLANEFKDKEPEEIVTTSVQMAAGAADTIVPLIRGFIK